MSAFAKARGKTRAASMCVVVPTSAFSDDWEGKPTGEIAFGLRLLSETAIQAARRIATNEAVAAYVHEGQVSDPISYIEALNDGLVREAIARAICDPNDVTQPHPILPFAEDLVPVALTPEGQRYVWDALHHETIARSPVVKAIDDDEVTRLAALLERGAIAKLPPHKALAARKLLGSVLDDIDEALR